MSDTQQAYRQMAEASRAQAQAARSTAEAAVAASDENVRRERDDYHKLITGRPTPTQHENDLIKAGAPPAQKEDDGAVVNPVAGLRLELKAKESGGTTTRAMEAQPGGGYQTRQVRRTPPPPPPTSGE